MLPAFLGLLGTAGLAVAAPGNAVNPLPQRLSETGLHAAGPVTQIGRDALEFSPQYPLWSDGASKRRWISLPAGTSIDASNPDAWEFPVGTKLWKEFALGRPIETRYIERLADGSWRFATYVWNADGTEATLAPEGGIVALPLRNAAREGTYAVPGELDCRACHEGAPVPVLGFSALQLSPDRDPLAPHTDAQAQGAANVDLRALVARGLIRNLPQRLLDSAPRIAARTPTERAVLGYLHGNCGHCHSAPEATGASVPVGVVLAQSVSQAGLSAEAVRRSLVGATSRFRPHGANAPTRLVVPGASIASVLPLRMRSRDPRVQMPPLGTAEPDFAALALVDRWIDDDLHEPTALATANDTTRNPAQEENPSWTTASRTAALDAPPEPSRSSR
jgi:hypothetical protein